MILDDFPHEKKYMHPSDIFIYLTEYFEIDKIDFNETDKGTKSYSFNIDENQSIPKELFDAATTMSKYTKNSVFSEYDTNFTKITYVISKNGNKTLVFAQNNLTKKFSIKQQHDFSYIDQKCTIDPIIHIYDEGKIWNYSNKKDEFISYSSVSSGFPCSMKDLFYYQDSNNSISKAFYALFNYWGKEYKIWRDLAEDFKAGSSYCSIPTDLIFSCHNRKELVEKYAGNSLNRNNKENIGKGLFLAKAKKYIIPRDYQMLFEYNIATYFLSRDKKTFIHPLSIFIEKTLKSKFPEMKITKSKRVIKITSRFIIDTVRMALNLKIPLRLNFASLQTFYNYHNELMIKQRQKNVPLLKIPKNSRFKLLKMPKNCIRLTSRKQFIEEGVFQNNCVASYIDDVNQDLCSIWSMRNEDGTRYTIEIGIILDKRYEKGFKFVLRQMKGYANSVPPVAEEKLILKSLQQQNHINQTNEK